MGRSHRQFRVDASSYGAPNVGSVRLQADAAANSGVMLSPVPPDPSGDNPVGFPITYNTGWDCSFIFRWPNTESGIANPNTKARVYLGLAVHSVTNTAKRPAKFCGLRYDTNPGASFTLTAAGNASSGVTAYTGTFTGGGSNASKLSIHNHRIRSEAIMEPLYAAGLQQQPGFIQRFGCLGVTCGVRSQFGAIRHNLSFRCVRNGQDGTTFRLRHTIPESPLITIGIVSECVLLCRDKSCFRLTEARNNRSRCPLTRFQVTQMLPAQHLP